MTNEKKYKGDKMKTYKGFNKDMTCRDFQYEEGKEYEATGEIKCCNNGFHACEDPLDCFNYYAPGKSVYHEVEQSGEISRNNDGDSKVASSKIKIGARLDIAKIVNLHFDFVKSRTTFENTDPEQASAGERGAASAGWKGAASAGEKGAPLRVRKVPPLRVGKVPPLRVRMVPLYQKAQRLLAKTVLPAFAGMGAE